MLRKLKRFFWAANVFIGTYLGVVGLLWGAVEAATYFTGDFLQKKLGYFWWILFYAIPLPFSIITSLITYKKTNRKPFLDEFKRKTQQVIDAASLVITGTGKTFQKREVWITENQLEAGEPVLLVGEAGTGKSGVGITIARRAQDEGKTVLIIDARQVQFLQDEQALRSFYRCEESLDQTIASIGNETENFLLIIDQLDNVAGKTIADILVSAAIESSKAKGVQVVVISRRRESYENQLLQSFGQNGFAEIECRQLNEIEAREELIKIGFENPNQELVSMSRNLLNLEILSEIKTKNPNFTFGGTEDEVTLWDAFFETLRDRERLQSTPVAAEQTLTEAMNLARNALVSGDTAFVLENPLSDSRRRLVSCGIVEHSEGVRYRFKHEKIQDYLYARYAADYGYLPNNVLSEVGPIKSRNALVWLAQIYVKRNSPNQIHFLEVALNG